MDLRELTARIEKWEDLHTEFKQWPVSSDDLAVGLVAFANTDGGQFILGVTKDRRIQGVDDPDRAMQRLDNIAYNNCEPPITIIQETVRDDRGAVVVVVNIPKGDQRPYRTNKGDYYIRTTSGRRRASRQELLRLFQATETLFYDETLVLRASMQNIETRAVESFLNNAYQLSIDNLHVPLETFMSNLGLVRLHEGKYYPTVACILFFSDAPQEYVPHAKIAAARIPGVDFSAPPADAKQISGRLLDVLDETVRFLRIHLRTQHQIKKSR